MKPALEPPALLALENALRAERDALLKNDVETLVRSSADKLNALRMLEAVPPSLALAAHLSVLAELNRDNGVLLTRRRRVVDWTLRQLGRQQQATLYDPRGVLGVQPQNRALAVV